MRRDSVVADSRLGAIVLAMSLAASAPAHAYEGDVHYGLTLWLALRAGFDAAHAEAIAVANQRMDGGTPETQVLALEYACAGRFDRAARQFQSTRFPSAVPVPAPLPARAVEAGGPPSRQALNVLADQLPGKESLMAGKLGEALHPLQDSWSHQGVPSMPDVADVLACDPTRYSGAPVARGGPASHAPSATHRWPDDTVAMARATYAVLTGYPPIAGRARQASDWGGLEPAVRTFAQADTKTRKRRWFVAQGMAETGFLQLTSLPDGPAPGLLRWHGWKLPALRGDASTQHDAAPDVRTFYDGLLARWFAGDPVETIAGDAGSRAASQELAARLKVWRLQDHGSVAELAHAPAPYSAAQRRAIHQAARRAQRAGPARSTSQAVFPLLPLSATPSPLVPYIVRPLPERAGRERALAILRLRHAPYDDVGLVAERAPGGWRLVQFVSVVD